MPRQVLMARLGIHRRLIFRVDDGRLEVLDLVPLPVVDMTVKCRRILAAVYSVGACSWRGGFDVPSSLRECA